MRDTLADVAQALYRKWRPQTFDDVVGQEHVTTTLKNQIATGRIGHAYLFVGSRGCGKTTSARIFAKDVNVAGLDLTPSRTQQIAEAISEGRALDVIEIDAASHTGVDDIREIRDRVSFQPSELRYKVYIIDEVHMLSTAAFNALLKTLEEPPPHVIFILATTDPQKIPATVLSRCQRFNFKRISVDHIVGRLRYLCNEEGIEADDHALRLIARYATGALRDAESLLDQLASSNSMRITIADVREALGATDAATVRALVDGLIAHDLSAGFDLLQHALDQGADARQVARQMVEYLRSLMQIKASTTATDSGGAAKTGNLSEAERIELAGQAERLTMPHIAQAVRAFSEAINEMRGVIDAQLCLEMAYLKCVVDEDGRPPAIAQPSPAGTAVQQHATVPAAPARPASRQERETIVPITLSTAKQPPEILQQPQPQPPMTPAAEPGAALVQPPDDTAGSQSGLSLETLKAQWQQFIREVNVSNKPVAALLRSCDLHSVVGNSVYLRAHHDIPHKRLQEPKNRASVIAVLNRMFNGKYDLHVFVNQAQQEFDPDDDPVLKAAKKLGGQVRT